MRADKFHTRKKLLLLNFNKIAFLGGLVVSTRGFIEIARSTKLLKRLKR